MRGLPLPRFLIALLLALVLPATAHAASIVEQHGRLQVHGNRVVDAKGVPVTLRGMSLFWSQWKPAFYNRAAINWLRTDWNITAIRAAIAAHGGGYDRDPEGQTKRAEAAIDAAIAEGIYVVVDWHAHVPLPDEAVRFFTHIARKYRGVPNLIYETWNEPLPQHSWAGVLKPYHLRVIGAIRAEDPGAFVIAGTRSWSQDVDEAAADPLPLKNVAYVLHFYAATHGQYLRDKGDLALKRGVALFVSEYGTTAANGDLPIDAAETQRWWDWMEANGISYLGWSVNDKAEASAILLPGGSPTGNWPESALTTSGRTMRAHLRSKR